VHLLVEVGLELDAFILQLLQRLQSPLHHLGQTAHTQHTSQLVIKENRRDSHSYLHKKIEREVWDEASKSLDIFIEKVETYDWM
jgi:hypothetical protein